MYHLENHVEFKECRPATFQQRLPYLVRPIYITPAERTEDINYKKSGRIPVARTSPGQFRPRKKETGCVASDTAQVREDAFRTSSQRRVGKALWNIRRFEAGARPLSWYMYEFRYVAIAIIHNRPIPCPDSCSLIKILENSGFRSNMFSDMYALCCKSKLRGFDCWFNASEMQKVFRTARQPNSR